MRVRSVTIQVPASTSNLGPGFDTLGIALSLYARVSVARNHSARIQLQSQLEQAQREGALTMLRDAARFFFQTSDVKPFGADVWIQARVPVARGLGSSVCIRLGLAAALNELSGSPLSRPDLLNLVTQLEHHPDNAAPAVFGGFAVAARLGGEVRSLHYKIPSQVRFVALIPNFEINTERARALLPAHYSREDAVHNVSRAALLAAALATRKFDVVKSLFEDRFHQPYRQPLIPALPRVIAAGERAGALGGWLSGSGSTIICLTLENPAGVGRAMQEQLKESEVRVLRADNHGFRVVPKPVNSLEPIPKVPSKA